ncbi:MAG: DUF5011 domain-containing protein [Thermoanaerobaculales bacterium]|nr:DUF5011 domain-containing protein [Thermoanaerobaculales bacterium]
MHRIQSLAGELVLEETTLVYGPTAKHPIEFAGFQVNIFSETGSLIDTHSIMDPSEIRYIGPGGGSARDTSFEVVVPFGDRPREFEIVKKSTGELSLKNDLRDAIADFCSGSIEDPQCSGIQNETPPIADAGGPSTVPEGSSVTLNGSSSTDAAGSSAGLTFAWEIDGDSQYDDASAPTVDFSAAAISGPAARIVRLRTIDGEGLSDIDSTTVHIENVPPEALCADVSAVADSVSCNAPADVDGGSADPTRLDSVELAQDPPGPYGPGQTSVLLTVTDSSGGSDTCTATVTVADVTAPVITLNGAPNMWVKPGTAYSEPGASAVDACEGVLDVSIGGDVVDPHKPGVYTVTYDSQDTVGNPAVQATRTVTVSPTEIFRDGFESGDRINW